MTNNFWNNILNKVKDTRLGTYIGNSILGTQTQRGQQSGKTGADLSQQIKSLTNQLSNSGDTVNLDAVTKFGPKPTAPLAVEEGIETPNKLEYIDKTKDTDVNVGSNYTDTETEQASQTAQTAGEQATQAASQASRNAGVNRAGSGITSGTSGSTTAANTQGQVAAANSANRASTQADWLASQGYVNGLNQQAQNIKKGNLLTSIGAGLSGIGNGLSLGASISDENEKKPINDDINNDDLLNKVDEFMCLYKRLQELKGGK